MSGKAMIIKAVAGTSAVLLGLAGCSGSSNGNAAATQSSPASGSGAGGSTNSTDYNATASQSLSYWVAKVVDGDYPEACRDMATPASAAAGAAMLPASAAQCSPKATAPAGAQAPDTLLRSMHASFTPKKSSGNAQVAVSGVSPTGATVTVGSNQITVDGQSLTQVVLSHSTGVTAAQLDISFQVSKIAGGWYVSNMNFNI